MLLERGQRRTRRTAPGDQQAEDWDWALDESLVLASQFASVSLQTCGFSIHQLLTVSGKRPANGSAGLPACATSRPSAGCQRGGAAGRAVAALGEHRWCVRAPLSLAFAFCPGE